MGKRATFALMAVLSAGGPLTELSAQDYNQYQPKEVPRSSESPQLTAPQPKVTGDDRVLVAALKAVVFVDAKSKVQPHGVEATGIETAGIPLPDEKAFKDRVNPYLGQPLSVRRLNALVKDVILYFREHDRPVVDVVVPEQDVTTGIVQIVITQAKVGEVRAEGNRWFDSGLLTGQVREQKGDQIRATHLLKDLDWINQNPFRQTDVVFTPGKEDGYTDIVLKTKDRFPVRFYTGYDDSGNALTGYDRWWAGFNWGNAFFTDSQLNYQYTTSSNFVDLQAHSLSYIAPLPWRHTLTLYGSVSTSQANSTVFNNTGSSSQLGLRYAIPLPDLTLKSLKYNEEFILGFDWKQSDNSLEFGATPVSASTTDVGEWVFGYHSGLTDPWGKTTFSAEVYYSPGDWFDHQTDADYHATRPLTSAEYAYSKLEASRLTRLPGDFSLYNDFTWQFSNANLLASEQLPFGGYDSVRGYDERELTGTDEGWVLRNELRTPPISLLQLCGVDKVHDQLQFLAFWDYGIAKSYNGPITLLNGQSVREAHLSGVGPGVRYTVDQYLTVTADYGFQMISVGDPRSGSRLDLSVMLSY